MKHTVQHALYGCSCSMREITRCVICGRVLPGDRDHTDTCRGACFHMLLKWHRYHVKAHEETQW